MGFWCPPECKLLAHRKSNYCDHNQFNLDFKTFVYNFNQCIRAQTAMSFFDILIKTLIKWRRSTDESDLSALACLTTRPAVKAKMLEMAYSIVCELRLICLNTVPWTRAANRKFKWPTNTIHRPVFIRDVGFCTLVQDTPETETTDRGLKLFCFTFNFSTHRYFNIM